MQRQVWLVDAQSRRTAVCEERYYRLRVWLKCVMFPHLEERAALALSSPAAAAEAAMAAASCRKAARSSSIRFSSSLIMLTCLSANCCTHNNAN